MLLSAVVTIGTLLGSASATTAKLTAVISGDFNITNYRLYPENSDYDSRNKKLYLGSNFNASVLEYDPFTTQQKVITFEGITGNSNYHISGVDYDSYTGYVYFSANAGEPFVSRGANLTGSNKLIKYDPVAGKVVWEASMDNFAATVEKETGSAVNGFEDMEQDASGNCYYSAAYGGAIAKVSSGGEVTSFYVPKHINNSVASYQGLVWTNNKLIAHDDSVSQLVYFDTTSTSPEPVNITTTGLPSTLVLDCDGLYFPPKYNNKILLCSSDSQDAIYVFKSSDVWRTTRFLGSVANPITGSALPTSTVQIEQSIYINEEYFLDSGAFDAAGNRSVFPYVDITSKVASLANAHS
ncbi:hypothetical protein BP5796_13045 [Coleophoma crateriformis]|uniref:Uncharacterized protein n=1 Tax=Coleophoma crateriformis TaxID=565419 RepID=A0A3D8Q5Q8_9HELO|nr:hypothetical protein BP5796_13045 [Coleophoma crateriformis]